MVFTGVICMSFMCEKLSGSIFRIMLRHVPCVIRFASRWVFVVILNAKGVMCSYLLTFEWQCMWVTAVFWNIPDWGYFGELQGNSWEFCYIWRVVVLIRTAVQLTIICRRHFYGYVNNILRIYFVVSGLRSVIIVQGIAGKFPGILPHMKSGLPSSELQSCWLLFADDIFMVMWIIFLRIYLSSTAFMSHASGVVLTWASELLT